MSDLRSCPYCGKTELSCRYWQEEVELWELWGVTPENLLECWNMHYFPPEDDEEELMSHITGASVCCGCGAQVFGTIDRTDGEYDFIRRWNRRVKE